MKKTSILMLVLLLALVCSIAVPASASEDNIPIPSQDLLDQMDALYFKDYAIIQNGDIFLYGFSGPLVMDIDVGNVRTSKAGYRVYRLKDGDWVYESTSSNNITFTYSPTMNILYSSHNIYYMLDGEIDMLGDPYMEANETFFPTPQVGVVEMAKELTPPTMKTMGLLTVCGIGLMALLMALKVLPKILRKFLP